jgi:STE24 endopeptidase
MNSALIKNQKFYRWLFLALVAVILLSPLPYWTTGIGQSAHRLSAQVTRLADGTLASSPKAEARHSLMLPMRLERMVVYPLLLLAFQLSGGGLALRRWLEQKSPGQATGGEQAGPADMPPASGRWQSMAGGWFRNLAAYARRRQVTGRELLVILLFVVIFDLGLILLYLPFNFYRGFIVGHQFGLSTLSLAGWFGDWTKGGLIMLVTDGLLWTGFYGLMRLFPRRWPLPGGAAVLALGFVFTLLSPIVITPLFYEVSPLTDSALRTRILALTERAGMEVDEVYVIDASAKTTTVNAYFTGFGDARRIVLFDTLLTGYSPDEVEVVLAHEMGHWYHRHMFGGVLGYGAAAWVGLFALRWLLQRIWRPLGLRSPADVAGLPFLLAVIALVTMLALPFETGVSRWAERQADRFALTVSQKPAAFVELFEQFAGQNLSIVDPPAWEKFVFYTHPPIVERIQMAETVQEQ